MFSGALSPPQNSLVSDGINFSEPWSFAALHQHISQYPVDDLDDDYHATQIPSTGPLPDNNIPSSDSDFDARDQDGKTQLHHAVIGGAQKHVEELLTRGATIDVQDASGNNPLHYAASKVLCGIIELLLTWKADVDASGNKGGTPLHMAIRSPKAVKVLLKARLSLLAQDDDGNTPLHLAVLTSGLNTPLKGSIIEKLIHLGADVNFPNKAGSTPFHLIISQQYSSRKNWMNFIMLFLENNADVLLPTRDDKSPFQVFLDRSGLVAGESVFKCFLKKGADPNTRLTSGESLFHLALTSKRLWYYHDELLEVLYSTVDINEPLSDGDLPLHSTLSGCGPDWNVDVYTKPLECLLNRDADPNERNRAGQTPLAVLLKPQKGRCAGIGLVLELLLRKGANPMGRNSAGDLPVYLATRNFTGEVQNTLIKLLVGSFLRTNDEIDESHSGYRDDNEWWHTYQISRRQKHWNTRLAIPPRGMPADVASVLPRKVLTMAAEDILANSKVEFSELKAVFGLQHEDTRIKCDLIITILRDCLSLKLDIEPEWYHFPLEFFD